MFHFSPEVVKETFEEQKGKCLICSTELDPDNHESFFYQSNGKGTDSVSNCFLLCPECHEKFLQSSLEDVNYPATDHGYEIKKIKSPAAAAVLGAVFPRFGMLYIGGRFCLLNWGIFVLLVIIQNVIVLPTYELAVAETIFVNVGFRVYAGILGYKMAKYQTGILKAYIEENDLNPEFYGGTK